MNQLKSIVLKIQQKNSKFERELFNLMSPRLFQICRRYARDDNEAKDYLQECFIKVFSNINAFDTDKQGNFESWFFKVSVNTILSIKRKTKKIQETELNIEIHDTEDTSIELENYKIDQVVSMIQLLPESYRVILNLRVFEELDHNTIGTMLGVTPSTSRSKYTRAKKMLKKLIIKSNIHEAQCI